MSPKPSVAIRVAPEFAALVRRMARYAAQGQPMTRGRRATLPAVTGVLARLLATSPLNSASWWVVPDMGTLLRQATVPEHTGPLHGRDAIDTEDGVGPDGEVSYK